MSCSNDVSDSMRKSKRHMIIAATLLATALFCSPIIVALVCNAVRTIQVKRFSLVFEKELFLEHLSRATLLRARFRHHP